ncbi:MAG TPA: ammonium transporter [Streptosporangiaceae bacterium]|nr:ammonium transporter [Streptosporangiaceae bacterium]
MHISAGDTAWMLTSTALVLFMMPGLALFYGGLVGAKNVIATMVQSFVAIGLISLLWVIVGYSLTFGADHGGVIGGLQNAMLVGVGAKPNSYAPTIPALLYMAFQMKFAVITPALIAGAFCERMRFRGYLVFIGLWSLLVYFPFAHAVWGAGGILGSGGLHAIDFAGGSVVHELAGSAALATALFLKRRHQLERPHSIPLVLLGAGILWFGWFGFNAGSALSAGSVATSALVNTQLGGSAAMLAWMTVEWWRRGKPTGAGIAAGAVAGLAAITPASGYVPPWAAIIIGAAAGLLCYSAVHLKDIFHYDDSLDVVGVHMVGGLIGVVLTGVFASLAVNAAGQPGGLTQLGRQLVLAIAGIAFPFVMTWIILWITDKTVGLRVDPEEEQAGLDLAQHGEPAYGDAPARVLATAGVASNGESAASGTAGGEAAAPEEVS